MAGGWKEKEEQSQDYTALVQLKGHN